MAKVLAISKNHQYKGSFTNNKNVWNAIKEMLNDDPDIDNDNVSDDDVAELLVLEDEKGKIKGELPSGNVKTFVTATYAHLCSILRKENKAALHSAVDFMPVFGVWLGTMNEIYTSEIFPK